MDVIRLLFFDCATAFHVYSMFSEANQQAGVRIETCQRNNQKKEGKRNSG